MIRTHVLICGGTGCTSSGSLALKETLEKELAAKGLTEEVKIVITGCFGLCALGPVMIVYPDGTFYKHVDPGILRHMLFMGIVGYGVLVAYQLVLLPAWKMKTFSTKYYYMLILLFLFGMEYKCINIGVNKFAFSISLLLTYSYFYLGGDEHDEIKVDSITNNSDI